MVPTPTHPPGTSGLHLVHVDGVISTTAKRVKLDVSRHTLDLDLWDTVETPLEHLQISEQERRHSHHFQGSLDVNALAPGHGGISQAVARAPPAGHVHALASEVAERFCHDEDGVVGERRRVLKGHKEAQRFSPPIMQTQQLENTHKR